jgi:hypothetical protein
MTYSPLSNELHGTPAASVDPIALERAQAQINEINSIEEQRKRDEEEKQRQEAELDKQVQQQSQQQNSLGQMAATTLQRGIEVPTALVGGTIDFVEGIGQRYNIPWLEFPDQWEPQNTTTLGKALRSISEVAVPTVVLSALTRRGVNAGATRIAGAERVANAPKIAKYLGNAGLDAASGVAVDYVSRQSEDHNAMGILKKNFFPWIPDNIATLDSDSPDVKRAKNVYEGVGFGLAVDLLGAGIKAAKSVFKSSDGTTYIPKDQQAKEHFEGLAQRSGPPKSDDPASDYVIRSVDNRERVTDEWAEQQFAKDPDGLQGPHPAVNSPMYDETERAVLGVRRDAIPQNLVDGARISRNEGTVNGRMATVMTEAAQKKGLEVDNLQKRTLVQDTVKSINETGDFQAVVNGVRISKKEMIEAADPMVQQIINPNMDVAAVKSLFDDGRSVEGISQTRFINDRQYAAAMRATKQLIDQYIGLDTARASARLQTTMAGEVADIAQGARLVWNEVDTTRQQEMIFDKIEFLMAEMGINKYVSGWSLNNKKAWDQVMKEGDPASIQRFAKEAEAEITQATAERIAKAKEFVSSLQEIKASNPEFLKPLIEAYELTGGKVDTIDRLNKWFQNSTGFWKKAFIDGEPEVPSVVVQGLWATLYNSVLSSTLTPLKAFTGNLTALFFKPVSILGGSIIGGDKETIQRSLVQLGNLGETLQKATQHFGFILKKSIENPDGVSYAMREDVAIKNADTLMVLENVAKAKAAQGEMGPTVVVGIAKALHDFNNHPWVRYSANLMTAGDGFVRSVMANFEARGRVYDEMARETGGVIDHAALNKAQAKLYAEMFDANGMITDKAVEHASREIAMNLDSPAVQGLSALLNRYPAIRPFVMFPRTSMNVLSFAHKHSPLALAFGESNRILNAKTADEINEIMKSRGITDFSKQQWDQVVAETKGRIALGTITTMLASMLYLSGSLSGNGPYDKEARNAWTKAGWQPRSIRNPVTGEWHSYDSFEPFSTYLALVADIGDNVGHLGTASTEDLFRKLSFAFSMNITNKSFLQGLTPLNDMLSGDEAGFQRFVASQLNNIVPYASLRNQLGQLMYPGLREVDNEFQQLVRNRNAWVDAFSPETALPYARDFIDGSRIRDYDPMTRILNTVLPFKTNPSTEPYRQWLIKTGFEAMPVLKKSTGGIDYTPRERELIASYMGQYGDLPRKLTKLMNRKDIQKDLEFYSSQRRDFNVSSEQLNLAKSRVHTAIRKEFTAAKNRAEAVMYAEYPKLRRDAAIKSVKEKAQQRGDYDSVQRLLAIPK